MSAVVLVPGTRMPRRSRFVVLLCALTFAFVAVMTAAAPAARAGEWAQATCQNPDGSASNGQGWSVTTAAAAGDPGPGQGSYFPDPSGCSSTSAISATLDGSYPGTALIEDTYTPPSTSDMIGVTLNGSMTTSVANAEDIIYEPADTPADTVALCAFSNTPSCPSTTGPWSYTMAPNTTNAVFVQTACGSSCTAGSGPIATTTITSADFLLQNNASPALSGSPSGTALGSSVSGTAQLLFTATDTSGPGVYNVTVAVDGQTVYSATPNSNSGECVQHGDYPATSVPMYDGNQPCPTSTSVDASVPTTSFSNGTHELTATVTDAAGNSAKVIDQDITIANPVATPTAPTTPTVAAPLRKIRDKALFRWNYRQPVTRLTSVRLARHAHLPADARISVACEPVKLCPKKLPAGSVGVRKLAGLFDSLAGKHFRPGAVFQLTISAPHRRAERLLLRMRSRKSPVGHERAGEKALPANPTSSKHKRSSTKHKKKKK